MDQNDLYYIPGSWNVICDSCGKKIKASEAKMRWDGLIVCPDDFEQRQPQDFVKARADKITVPFSRPRPTDVFVPGASCNNLTMTCWADTGVADCAQVDYIGKNLICRSFIIPLDTSAVVGLAIVGKGIVNTINGRIIICAQTQADLLNLFPSLAGSAISGNAVAGTPISENPTF